MGIVNEDASRRQSPSRNPAVFPRDVRLLQHADFERVYKQGKRHFAADVTVFYRFRDGRGGIRVGFTVGRALGKAVDRNRMKRRLREAVRLQLPAVSAPVDVVLNPKKSLMKVDFSELVKEINKAFQVIAKTSDQSKVKAAL